MATMSWKFWVPDRGGMFGTSPELRTASICRCASWNSCELSSWSLMLAMLLFRLSIVPMVLVSWVRTVARLSASLPAPPTRACRWSTLPLILLVASASLLPISPAWKLSVACSSGAPVGRVTPRTAAMSGSCATRCAICSRSASPLVVRRSCGDWTKRYCGAVTLAGKWRSMAAMPMLLSAVAGSAVRAS
ncbi:Uncharacterised protein [Mycobacteroides abscessus subsp. abscessus]|nr:Uncharacterised protein [Mycobacteroides abscessus subsp. abscessus]